MNNAIERLMTERTKLKKERKYLFFANPIFEKGRLNMMKWKCSFPGPDNDLYKNSYYCVVLTFTHNYPFKPPKVKFEKKVFHPNIYESGDICLDILYSAWKPTMTIMQILTGVQQLLTSPNIRSPANGPASRVYKESKVEYEALVRENILINHRLPDFSKFPYM